MRRLHPPESVILVMPSEQEKFPCEVIILFHWLPKVYGL